VVEGKKCRFFVSETWFFVWGWGLDWVKKKERGKKIKKTAIIPEVGV
jgi:hypothetical protein